MMRFDPSETVTFDLSRGHVHLDGGPPCVLVPALALAALAEAAGGEAARRFGRALGLEIGRRAARRLSAIGGARDAAVNTVVAQLGGELGLAGFGVLSLERWGQAVVPVVDGVPLGPSGDALLGGVLEGAIEATTGAEATAIFLARDGSRARFLLLGDAGARKVQGWLDHGVSWGDALARLHQGARRSAPEGSDA